MISKFNAALVLLLVLCALAVVSAQNTARRLVVELNREVERARALEVEFGQLQLEQGTLAGHVRVAEVARKKLGMHVPVAGEVVVVDPRVEAQP